MSGLRNCNGGKVAKVTTIEPDCDCVGIASITQSADLTKMYVTLTNGTTQTFTLPTGAQGTAGANGTSLIYSDGDDHSTTTTGSFESLSAFSTDKTNVAKNLVNVGDTINLYAIYKLESSPTQVGINTALIINGAGLSNITLGGLTAGTVNVSNRCIVINTKLILTDNTANAMTLRVLVNTQILNESVIAYTYGNGGAIIQTHTQDIGGVGVDFSANNYMISACANSLSVGDIILQTFQAEKLTAI